ncbi:MAG TPA: hypothetical protein VF585_03025 [Chthoniobacterales bacterium]
MPLITAAELACFENDPQGSRGFELPYRLPSALGLVLILAGLGVGWRTSNLLLTGILVGSGFVIFMITIWIMFRATPRSSLTGLPLEKFRYVGRDAERLEVAYVDRHAKTYFRRTYSKRRRGNLNRSSI